MTDMKKIIDKSEEKRKAITELILKDIEKGMISLTKAQIRYININLRYAYDSGVVDGMKTSQNIIRGTK
jgi:hypothetical protein